MKCIKNLSAKLKRFENKNEITSNCKIVIKNNDMYYIITSDYSTIEKKMILDREENDIIENEVTQCVESKAKQILVTLE